MKSRTFALFVAAAVTTVGLDLHAQSKARQVGPTVSKSATRLDFLEVPDGSLKDAVHHLKKQLEAHNFPPMNIVYSRGAKDLLVPDLILRHVTGADALRLICTAAECEMEPIYSEPNTPEGRVVEYVIGYRVIAPTPRTMLRGYGSMTPGTRSSSTKSRVGPASPFSGASSPATTSGRAKSAYSSAGGGVSTTARSVKTPSGGTRLVSYGGTKPILFTRVYALGRITNRSKFPDVEKTLLATLQLSGHKPSDATLALHENTNVLIVRASEEIQDLVSNLLESLAQNTDDAETGEVADLERKLKALMIEAENVKQISEMRIQEAEKRRRQAEDELAKLRDLERARVLKR